MDNNNTEGYIPLPWFISVIESYLEVTWHEYFRFLKIWWGVNDVVYLGHTLI